MTYTEVMLTVIFIGVYLIYALLKDIAITLRDGKAAGKENT